MGRNRYVAVNLDTNKFRSNLMLLIQNLYTEGIPLPKLQLEYKKFFHEDISSGKMTQALKLVPPNPPTLNETEADIWIRIFNTPCLYEFFIAEEYQDEVAGKSINIKCRRGRTLNEMHALAQLATISNIDLLRSAGKNRMLDILICKNCSAVTPQLYNPKEAETAVGTMAKRKITDDPAVVPKKIAPQSTNAAAKNSSTDVSITNSASSIKTSAVDVGIRTTRSQSLRNSLVVVPTSSEFLNPKFENGTPVTNDDNHEVPTILTSESHPPSTNPNQALAKKIILRNHKGETKIVEYIAVVHKCVICDTMCSDRPSLLKHMQLCTKLRVCSSCGSFFKTSMMLRSHKLECGTNQETKRDQDIEVLNKKTNVENADIPPSPIVVKYEEDLTTTTF